MKKLLTLAATAGLLIAGANSASAQSVNFPGTVNSYCEVESVADGTLTENVVPATQLFTAPGDEGSVVVKCNDATGNLSLTTSVTSTIPAQPNAPAIQIGRAAGTGNFSTGAALATGPINTAIPVPTAAAGDTAAVIAQVDASGGALLLSGSYTVVVDAVVTP